MKTNKGLQVGNLLYNHRRWACPILEIGADRVTVIARHYGEETFLLEDMREIELSEELIPKLGFEKEKIKRIVTSTIFGYAYTI